jgi:dihydroorotate dehydrogenase
MFYKLIRPILFLFDAESVHRVVMSVTGFVLGLGLVRRLTRWWYAVRDERLEQHVLGLDFENPVGLAAGFDKNAEHFNALHALGFGHVEVGTVTGEGQIGNERPRLFRLKPDRGLLNRMGFNNKGSAAVEAHLSGATIEPTLGINIGKTKVVDLEDAPADYEKSFRRLFEYADYFVVNVSSPNTPGLRSLQNREPLTRLLSHLQELNRSLAETERSARKPILLKIAPDITEGMLDDILDVLEDCELDGIIATNTTIERDDLKTEGQEDLGPGGVSGKPVQEQSLELISAIYQKTGGAFPIIGVGGIFDADDALEAIRAGASLVQVWTGFVYEGPATVKRINKGLVDACRANGWTSISEARGLDVEIEGASADVAKRASA